MQARDVDTHPDTKQIIVGGLPTLLTPERTRRIEESIRETQRSLDKEMRYSEEFRDHQRCDGYKTHIAYLQKLLEGGKPMNQYILWDDEKILDSAEMSHEEAANRNNTRRDEGLSGRWIIATQEEDSH